MDDLKVGDVVKLKSGGPVMTVKTVAGGPYDSLEDGEVRCQWFAGANLKDAVFHRSILLDASDDPSLPGAVNKSLAERLRNARERTGIPTSFESVLRKKRGELSDTDAKE